MIEQSEQLNEIGAALAKAQAQIKSAMKENAVKTNQYTYRYADFAAVVEASRPALTENNISVIQMPMLDPELGRVIVSTMLLHSSGQWIRSAASANPKDLSPQSVGSTISYLRRYGMSAMVGVVSEEDDDGNAAQPQATPTQRPDVAKPSDPQAHNVSDLATPPQIKAAYAICSKIDRKLDDAVRYYFPDHELKPEELSKRAMSFVISELKKLEEKL